MRKNSSTLTIDNTTTTLTPAGLIHEGGDNTSTLEWGTTGSTSIVLPNPELPTNLQTFCIGNQCSESKGNAAPNAGTSRTQYLNRDRGDLNGTLEVKESVKIGSTEGLCIGSNCLENPGSAPENELYGQDGVMDGPIVVKGEAGDVRGLPIDGSDACFGSGC